MHQGTRLLKWYRKYGRILPWRSTNNPYHILVSEIMLQQTQVDRVLIFYSKFLNKFPTFTHLAQATNAQVIHAWAGLGYNKRALALKQIAQHITLKGVPHSIEAWLALKGIGPYTARAICLFAFHERFLPIDTNIRRVLGRMLLGKAYPNPKDDQEIAKRELDILPKRGNFFDVPQALFDLATTHCTKRPKCLTCPFQKTRLASKGFIENSHPPAPHIQKVRERIHRDKKYPDRIYRGRILTLVRTQKHIHIMKIGKKIDPLFVKQKDQSWVEQMIKRMVQDNLIMMRQKIISLA